MSKDHEKTQRIRKIDKVAPDDRGRSVWLGKVEPVELELVSTQMLQRVLKNEGDKTRSEIRKLAAGRKDGVLARDTATGRFHILSEADLKKAETSPPPSAEGAKRGNVSIGAPLTDTTRRKADELSLVSTQMLRKVVKTDGTIEAEAAKPKASGKKDGSRGFNPYDNN